MSLRLRLVLLFVVLTLLPTLPAAWVARDLLRRSVDLSLRAEVDEALEAGVRRARENLAQDRARLRDEADRWRRALENGGRPSADVPWHDPAVRVELDGIRLAVGDSVLDTPAAPTERGQPPRRLVHRVPLADGHELRLERAVDPQWREDAVRLADALQMSRSLRARRAEIERGFLLPFLLLTAGAVLVAILAALWIARGFTSRVDRLLRATEAVAAGDWQARSELHGRDELGRLGEGFDHMVATLDAQHRRLVDLETMAGWREMARALAHEIKNPLTPIQLTVEEMHQRYRGDDPEYRELLEECTRIVVEEVESLRQVVGRFRDFAKPVEIEPRPLDLNALLRDVGVLQRDLQVEWDLDEALPPVPADEDRLRQVLMNLASNAREATATHEGVGRLRLGSRRAGDRVLLTVEDDGPGIPPDQRTRIFEPYRSGKKTGLGLGLALVKGIVLAHGGSIEVEEGVWGGARFRIELPLSGGAEAADAQDSPDARSAKGDRKA